MNLLRLSSVLSIVFVVLAIIDQPRRPSRASQVFARSLGQPLRRTLHRVRSAALETEVQCASDPDQPSALVAYLENCEKSVLFIELM